MLPRTISRNVVFNGELFNLFPAARQSLEADKAADSRSSSRLAWYRPDLNQAFFVTIISGLQELSFYRPNVRVLFGGTGVKNTGRLLRMPLGVFREFSGTVFRLFRVLV